MSARIGTPTRVVDRRGGALFLLAWASAFAGCAGETAPPSRPDAGSLPDSGPPDAGSPDAAERPPDAGLPDAETTDAATPLDASLGSRCTYTAFAVSCAHETLVLSTGAGLPGREVHYQVPLGAPPAAGFPVVVAFQGTGLSAALSWSGGRLDLYGMFYQAFTIARLLEAGYAVITPEANADGSGYYDTNIPPYATAWEASPDHQLMLGIFAGIAAGDFGPIDSSSMFAMGFSSGGYMTSRMAVSYPGRFRSLAIQSASYATCGGSICVLPTTLPADHPPTLFLHGALDTSVPVATMSLYDTALRAQGVVTRVVIDSARGHEWLPVAPDEVLAWFDASR